MKPDLTSDERRTPEQIREHYEIEKELADTLRNAPRSERRRLYSSVYEDLFRRVPLHPLLTRKTSPAETARAVAARMKLLAPFLSADCTFLEIGPGDCSLSYEVARRVKQVYAVDVSERITDAATVPDNFRLILSDGCSLPVPPDSVDVAYSDQLMEHLHPDDALEQLRNVHDALVPGGVYLCITPNRLSGPHDVSRYFDPIATGLHLKEYTIAELSALFRSVGFSRVRVYAGARGVYARLPAFPLALLERLLLRLPVGSRNAIARSAPFRPLWGVRLVGTK